MRKYADVSVLVGGSSTTVAAKPACPDLRVERKDLSAEMLENQLIAALAGVTPWLVPLVNEYHRLALDALASSAKTGLKAWYRVRLPMGAREVTVLIRLIDEVGV